MRKCSVATNQHTVKIQRTTRYFETNIISFSFSNADKAIGLLGVLRHHPVADPEGILGLPPNVCSAPLDGDINALIFGAYPGRNRD